jgi:hypothetical protein
MGLIKTLRGSLARLSRWRPARKGEAGYQERQYVLKHPKTPIETAERISRRTFLQKKKGKSPEQAAEEQYPKYSRQESARNFMANFKRRRTYEKKAIYKHESAKDIRWFEKFKAKRLTPHVNEKGETVGGHHETQEYMRGKEFAERHPEVEKDFLKYVSSPAKKRDRRRRGSRSSDALRRRERANRQAARRRAA